MPLGIPLPTTITPRLRTDQKLIVPVRILYKGKEYHANGMVDTGAMATAVIGKPLAKEMDLKPTGSVKVVAVGGGDPQAAPTAWIDGISIPPANCHRGKEEILISDLPASDHDLIVGLAFIEDTGADIINGRTVCKGGKPTLIFSQETEKGTVTVPKGAIYAGIGIGVLIFGIIGYQLLRK